MSTAVIFLDVSMIIGLRKLKAARFPMHAQLLLLRLNR